jgi:SAM-dependent methyltransferase
MDPSDPAWKGQRDYTRALLHLYDPIVIGHLGKRLWGVPEAPLLEPYRTYPRDNHLDVGPGTGYFLDRSSLPPGSRVTILDPNRNVLRHVSRRLTQFQLTAVEADVLKPLPVRGPFASAALNLVLHCLPGPLDRKALAIANIADVLAPTGVLFGATVLGRSADHGRLGRAALRVFNRQGGFVNLDDTEGGIRDILDASFEEVSVDIVRSVAVFVARRPRRPA